MSALETTRESRFVPGSNLKGAVAGANWWFLLPSLEVGRVVCLGAPTPAALATLARMSAEVVVSAPARSLQRIRGSVETDGRTDVRLVESGRGGAAPLPDASADVVVACGRAGRQRGREMERLLKPSGLAYVEGARPFGGLEPGLTLWLAPASGEARTAALLGDGGTIAYLERRFLRHGLAGRRLLLHPRRFLGRHVLVNRLARRRGALLGEWGLADGPPRYIRAIAAESGLELERHRWGLSAPGAFPSQKVLFFLFEDGAEKPEHIVKITRDPALNSRLEKEWRALTLLQEERLGASLPRPAFSGRHAGLAVVGETAIDGVPFRERTRATPDCPYAQAAADWLVELGASTAHPPAGGAPAVAAALEGLLGEFAGIYELEEAHERFLAEQVDTLAQSGNGLPLVFQHGDPGPWNLLVTPEGKPVFLDWEAAEPEGMPLWDLFHFLRSYGLAVSRAAGTHDAVRSFAQHYLADSALSPLFVEATRRACADTGLAPRLVEPLFYLCWMHRALKEATRLAPGRLDEGRYVNLLRLAIERREAPALRRLFSVEGRGVEPG
ncbi:MAG: phosphotransferase [Gaiellaceae bacterium]